VFFRFYHYAFGYVPTFEGMEIRAIVKVGIVPILVRVLNLEVVNRMDSTVSKAGKPWVGAGCDLEGFAIPEVYTPACYIRLRNMEVFDFFDAAISKRNKSLKRTTGGFQIWAVKEASYVSNAVSSSESEVLGKVGDF
jgi:hypothetical protein